MFKPAGALLQFKGNRQTAARRRILNIERLQGLPPRRRGVLHGLFDRQSDRVFAGQSPAPVVWNGCQLAEGSLSFITADHGFSHAVYGQAQRCVCQRRQVAHSPELLNTGQRGHPAQKSRRVFAVPLHRARAKAHRRCEPLEFIRTIACKEGQIHKVELAGTFSLHELDMNRVGIASVNERFDHAVIRKPRNFDNPLFLRIGNAAVE